MAAEVADLEWQAAQQSLMLRTVERYFDAALAAESLQVMRQQQGAVDAALAEVGDRSGWGMCR